MTLIRRCMLLFLAATPMSWLSAAENRLADQVDWPAFLRRHDLIWETIPQSWASGAFLGNGLLGLMIHAEENGPLRFVVGRSDVTDHRNGSNTLVDQGRLPIGHFELRTVGAVQDGDMRLDLWNAEASGTLRTDRGTVTWRAIVAATEDIIAIELHPTGGEIGSRLEWLPALSESPRIYGKGRPSGYQANPPPVVTAAGAIHTCQQSLLDGGDYTTAWRQRSLPDNGILALATVGNSWRIVNGAVQPGGADAQTNGRSEAMATLQSQENADLAAIRQRHQQWWHSYYPQSFISIPDTRLESFYWIQMYKMAAGTRPDRPALDLMGPWYKTTIWPAIWWNLNIQLTYSPVYTANRLEIGESFCRMLDANLDHLVQNVERHAQGKGSFSAVDFTDDSAWIARATSYDLAGGMFKGQRGAPEIGNLPWACHNYWRQCRYAGDDARMRDKLYPLLRRAINFYLHQLQKDDSGTYHLPPTYSPELGYAPDCNYDLALLRWGCSTLVELSGRFAINDPLLPTWRDVLAHLADYPNDEHGFMLGRDWPFTKSHRHYSHLLMIFPLYQVNWDQPENRPLITRSVDNWTGLKGAFAGYSFTGAASMYAAMNRGNDAHAMLTAFMDKVLTPNTMYLEADSPVIETPLSGAESLQCMLLQSWGGTIRVFPGIPDAWSDTTFHHLRAEGAFLVSAARHNGTTSWVEITSLAGEPCRVRPNLTGPARATVPIQPISDGLYSLTLQKGESAILYTGDALPTLAISPVAARPDQQNRFGMRKAAGRP